MTMLMRILALAFFMRLAAAGEPFDIQPFRDANGRFLAILAAAEGGQPKDLRTPEFTRLVALMSDEERFLRARKFVQDDMGTLMDLCDMANRNDMSLMFFNVKSHMDPQWSEAEKLRNLGVRVDQNSLEFQAELSTLLPFHIRCIGAGMPLLEEFARQLPADQMTSVRRDGLTKMRNGYAQMLTGLLQNIEDARFGADFRGALADAIADVSPSLASVMTLAQRAQLLEVVNRSHPTTPRGKAAHERIQAALQNKDCSLLCAF